MVLSSIKSILGAILILILLSILLIPVFVGVYYFNKEQCQTQSTQMGFDYKYNLWVGCMIKSEQGWINIDNYKIFAED